MRSVCSCAFGKALFTADKPWFLPLNGRTDCPKPRLIRAKAGGAWIPERASGAFALRIKAGIRRAQCHALRLHAFFPSLSYAEWRLPRSAHALLVCAARFVRLAFSPERYMMPAERPLKTNAPAHGIKACGRSVRVVRLPPVARRSRIGKGNPLPLQRIPLRNLLFALRKLWFVQIRAN